MVTSIIDADTFAGIEASSVSSGKSHDHDVEVLVKRKGGKTYSRTSYRHNLTWVHVYTVTGGAMV